MMKKIILPLLSIMIIIIYIVYLNFKPIHFTGYSKGDIIYEVGDNEDEYRYISIQDGLFSEAVVKKMLEDTNDKFKCLVDVDNKAVCYYKNQDHSANYKTTTLSYNKDTNEGKLTLKDSLALDYVVNYIVLDLNKYQLPNKVIVSVDKEYSIDDSEKSIVKNGLSINIEEVKYKIYKGNNAKKDHVNKIDRGEIE